MGRTFLSISQVKCFPNPCELSCFRCVQRFATPWTTAPTRLLCPWDFPGKNAGVCCHFLLQGIFPTQGSNPGLLSLLHWQGDSLTLVPAGKPREYCAWIWTPKVYARGKWGPEGGAVFPIFLCHSQPSSLKFRISGLKKGLEVILPNHPTDNWQC